MQLETVDEPDDVAEEPKSEEVEDEDGKVEDESEPKKKKVEKTIWDWVLTNESKPIWTKKYDIYHNQNILKKRLANYFLGAFLWTIINIHTVITELSRL